MLLGRDASDIPQRPSLATWLVDPSRALWHRMRRFSSGVCHHVNPLKTCHCPRYPSFGPRRAASKPMRRAREQHQATRLAQDPNHESEAVEYLFRYCQAPLCFSHTDILQAPLVNKRQYGVNKYFVPVWTHGARSRMQGRIKAKPSRTGIGW